MRAVGRNRKTYRRYGYLDIIVSDASGTKKDNP
jgi:hypothetical protein